MRIKPFKALYPNMKLVPAAEYFFGVMKQEFPGYLKKGFFKRTKHKYLFIYQIVTKTKTSTGLIASTSVDDILEDKILKHEHTIAKKEQQMMDLALQRNAMIKPVLLAHKRVEGLTKIYEQVCKGKPFLTIPFKEEKSKHYVWKVNEKHSSEIIKLFKKNVQKSYIADGHHRVSTGMLLNKTKMNTNAEFGDLLSIYFSFDQLEIFDYNRVVSILKEISPVQLMSQLSKYFKIKPLQKLSKPTKKHRIIFLIGSEVYQLKWKEKFVQQVDDEILLDAGLLNEYIFENIMGVKDVRTDSRISYIGGTEGVEGVKASLIKNDYAVGFILYPVQKEELTKLADRRLTLPPKSTWFEPRIKNAIISQEFE